MMARLMMSAAVPWIGALIAARSPKLRRAGFLSLMVGMWTLAPEQGGDEAVLAAQPWHAFPCSRGCPG